MVPDQYKDLRALILDLMVDVAMETKAKKNNNSTDGNQGEAQVASQTGETGFAFEGAFDYDDDDVSAANNDASTEESIRIRCEAQLAAYELRDKMPMRNGDGKFNDPLKFWKEAASQFPELAKLAQEYLSIPATSAPSERVWSRAARVLSAKRARLDPTVTSSIMFVQENSTLIRKHWDELMPGQPLNEFFLPPPFKDEDENGNPIDIGQNDAY